MYWFVLGDLEKHVIFFTLHVHGFPFIFKKQGGGGARPQRLKSRGWCVIKSGFCLALLDEISSGCSRVCNMLPICL